MYTGFLWGHLRKGHHFEDPGVHWRVILKWIFENWNWGMDWIDLAYDKDWWQALVNVVINVRVP